MQLVSLKEHSGVTVVVVAVDSIISEVGKMHSSPEQ